MEQTIAGGFIGLIFLFSAFMALMLAVPLAILWEQDAWLFKDVPWWLMPVLVPIWLLVTIWQGLFHAN